MTRTVEVRGGASAEDVAAVLAVLARVATNGPAESGYARWRRVRLESMRREARRREADVTD